MADVDTFGTEKKVKGYQVIRSESAPDNLITLFSGLEFNERQEERQRRSNSHEDHQDLPYQHF